MKIPKPFLFLFAALLSLGALTPTHARAQVAAGFFYDRLGAYGEWVETPDYGYVWHPTAVDENWAPYTDGYWAYTDQGWTWVSYEDYGSVVYHYGRWTRIHGEGWVWVPGYTWAPAWVSWRTSDDYVGWAPLPPEARWSVGIGFSSWVDARFDIGPGFYSFVGVRDFGAPALGPVIVNREQNTTIINNTTNITNITVNNSNVYTGGPSYAKYAGLSAKPIPTLKLVRQSSVAAGGNGLSHQQGNQLVMLAPKITAPPGGKLPAPPKVARKLMSDTADHGWDGVKDPQEREKLHAQIKEQAGSDTNSPAKPVSTEELKAVNDKIKSGGETKTAAAAGGESPVPKKSKKAKTPSTEDLANAPATEPGAAASASPKAKKSKKAKTPSEYEGGAGAADETPIPKKSKKAKTPSDYEPGATGDETPSKHSKKNSDADLQPFMGGDSSSSEPKTKKNSEEPDTSKSSEGKSSEAGYPASGAKSPKDKKKKDEQDQYPPTGQ